jgi:hypothetical protein
MPPCRALAAESEQEEKASAEKTAAEKERKGLQEKHMAAEARLKAEAKQQVQAAREEAAALKVIIYKPCGGWFLAPIQIGIGASMVGECLFQGWTSNTHFLWLL